MKQQPNLESDTGSRARGADAGNRSTSGHPESESKSKPSESGWQSCLGAAVCSLMSSECLQGSSLPCFRSAPSPSPALRCRGGSDQA